MDLSQYSHMEREMMFIKVGVEKNSACEAVKRLSDIFRGNIIDVSDKTYTIELTGDRSKLDAFVNALKDYRIIEVVRSGSMGIARGEASLHI
jgi:acetolactate synthase I/III small subunit